MYSLCLYAMHVFLYVPERLHLDASVHVSLMIHVSHLAQTILFIFYLLLIPISGQKIQSELPSSMGLLEREERRRKDTRGEGEVG